MPASTTTVPLVPPPAHSCPSARPQFAGPEGGDAAHVPSVCPAAFVHIPVQQSVPAAHESFGWEQKDDAWQVPLVAQRCEQHWAPDVHALPTVAQVELKGAHVPATQFWLQQPPADVQG